MKPMHTHSTSINQHGVNCRDHDPMHTRPTLPRPRLPGRVPVLPDGPPGKNICPGINAPAHRPAGGAPPGAENQA